MIMNTMNKKFDFKSFAKKNIMILILIVLVIVCSVSSEYFLTANNLLNVIRQVSISGILSIGMTLVLLTGGIDLSIGYIMAMVTVLIASFADINPIVVVIIAVIGGIVCGTANGSLITFVGIPPFIVTLGMMKVLDGIALMISNGSPIPKSPEALLFLGRGKIGGVFPVQAVVVILVCIVIAIMLKKTKLGRYIYAIGGNSEASRLCGINVHKVTIAVYVICGVLAAIGGILMETQLGMGKSGVGEGYEMDAITAAVIGGTSLSGGVGTVGGTIIGAFIIGILSNFLNLMNVSSYYQTIIKGAIVVVASAIQCGGLLKKRKSI